MKIENTRKILISVMSLLVLVYLLTNYILLFKNRNVKITNQDSSSGEIENKPVSTTYIFENKNGLRFTVPNDVIASPSTIEDKNAADSRHFHFREVLNYSGLYLSIKYLGYKFNQSEFDNWFDILVEANRKSECLVDSDKENYTIQTTHCYTEIGEDGGFSNYSSGGESLDTTSYMMTDIGLIRYSLNKSNETSNAIWNSLEVFNPETESSTSGDVNIRPKIFPYTQEILDQNTFSFTEGPFPIREDLGFKRDLESEERWLGIWHYNYFVASNKYGEEIEVVYFGYPNLYGPEVNRNIQLVRIPREEGLTESLMINYKKDDLGEKILDLNISYTEENYIVYSPETSGPIWDSNSFVVHEK